MSYAVTLEIVNRTYTADWHVLEFDARCPAFDSGYYFLVDFVHEFGRRKECKATSIKRNM